MVGQAQVTSVEAIEQFRANLILFVSRTRAVLEDVSNDVVRTRLWLQSDRRPHWKTQLRIRQRALERAQADVLEAKLSKDPYSLGEKQGLVRKAQAAVFEAESKLELIKRWEREMDNRVPPLVKQLGPLEGFISHDVKRAVAKLSETINALEAYLEVSGGVGVSTVTTSPVANKKT